jgi:4a-hydroxytetrahydrobiopterin dehydratase
MTSSLAARSCEPCKGGVPPLERAEAERYLKDVPGWSLDEEARRISRTFKFKDFAAAQAFAVKVGAIAEEEGHHPTISYGWGFCTIEIWTHKIDGLHENDFILAAKIDALGA